jgi:serine/threonine protein kinase
MEFLNGGSLEWYLRHQSFNEREAVFYSAQILCGILFLHSKKIVHRDIKLSNVLLDSNGNAKLCDFGFCVKISDNVAYSVGTPHFKSPESFTPGNVSYSVDFWSWAACIYCMLAGEYPFNEEEIEKNTYEMPDINKTREKKRTLI